MSIVPVANPNWPVMDYAVCWAAGRGATPVQDNWCSIAERTEGKVTVDRGKQYELDQVQPGEAKLTLRNDDGVFDPANGSSPYAAYLLPYRLMRIRAQWSPTVNLLTPEQASANKANGLTLPSLWTYALGQPVTVTALDATVNQYAIAYPATPAVNTGMSLTGWSVAPGVTYSASAQVAASAANGLQAYAVIVWYTAAGATISVSFGAAATIGTGTTTISVSAAAPANAAGAAYRILCANSPALATTLNVSRLQLEKAAAPTAWVLPGTWYSVFTGYIERFPQKWQSGGNYGLSDLVVVDLFAWWASQGLNYCAYLDLLALGPTWFYPLNDPQGATAFADASGANRSPATISPRGAYPSTSITPGQSMVGNPGTQPPLGIPTTVAGSVNVSGAVSNEVIDLTGAGANPAGPQSSTWTRIIGFQLSIDKLLAGTTAYVFAIQGPAGSKARIYATVNYDANGSPNTFNINVYNRAGTLVGQAATTTTALDVANGGWHLVTFSADATTLTASFDGAAMNYASAGSMPTTADFAGGFDAVGGFWQTDTKAVTGQVGTGQFAFLAELPYRINATQFYNLLHSFKYAWSGSDLGSDNRYARILAWAGYTGPTSLQNGALGTYGPAVDISGGAQPTSVLAALQSVVTSEAGQHFITAGGVVTFQSRRARVNRSPLQSFGEQAGEVPYLDAQTDFDPTRLANLISVTATLSVAAAGALAADLTSQGNFGIVTLQRTVNSNNWVDLLGMAQYLLYQNATPSSRFEAVPVDVASNPAVWPLLLGRELGDPVLVNRRPSNAPAIALQGFLEHVSWEFADDGSAKWTGQVSTNAQHQFCQLDSATYGLLDSTAILGY